MRPPGAHLVIAAALAAIFSGASARAASDTVLDETGRPVSILHFPEDRPSITLPLRRAGDLLLTDRVRINGRDVGLFIIDTGALFTLIDRSVARRLRLSNWERFEAVGAGGKFDAWVHRVESLAIDAMSFENHFVISADLTPLLRGRRSPVAGVLGGDVWARLPFTIDYGGSTVTFHARDAFTPPADAEPHLLVPQIAATSSGMFGRANALLGHPRTPARINEAIHVLATLDTADTGSVSLTPVLVRRFPDLVRWDRPTTPGVLGAEYQSYQANIHSLMLFGRQFTKLFGASAAVDPRPPNPRPNSAPITVGAEVLRGYRLTFDHAGRRIWTKRQPPLPMRHRLEAGLDVGARDLFGYAPLHEAAEYGEPDDVRALIEASADLDARSHLGATPLALAIGRDRTDTALLLIEAGADIELPNEKGIRPLQLAAFLADHRVFNVLLDRGADVNARDGDGSTLLYTAAAGGDVEMVRRVLSLRPDPDVDAKTIDEGFAPLHIAAQIGHAEIVRLLLEAGADVNAPSREEFTPLMAAANHGRVDVMPLLIDAGAEVDAAARDGRTALIAAAAAGRPPAVRLLLDAGADPHATYSNGCTVACAAAARDLETLKLLVDAGADPLADAGASSPLFLASRAGRADIVEYLLRLGAEADRRNVRGETPLMAAAGQGHLWVVKTLLRAGADARLASHRRYNALHAAAGNGHADVVRALLRAGAPPDEPGGRNAATPLFLACNAGHARVARLLLEAGADPSAYAATGGAPLHVAASEGHEQIVLMLLDKGADIGQSAISPRTDPRAGANRLSLASAPSSFLESNADKKKDADVDKDGDEQTVRFDVDAVLRSLDEDAGPAKNNAAGWNALHLATRGGYERVGRALLRHGANPDAPLPERATPLHIAAFAGYDDLVTLLLEAGAASDAATSDAGETPLMVAAQAGHTAVVRKLIEAGADASRPSGRGRTALHHAGSNGHTKIVEALLAADPDVNAATDRRRMTPLHWAALKGHTPIVRLLLDAGADPTLENFADMTAADLARRNGHTDLARLLDNTQTNGKPSPHPPPAPTP